MKKLNTFGVIISDRFIRTIAMAVVFFMAHPVYAQAEKLEKVKNILEKFRGELNLIIPVAAAVILLCLAIGYAGRYIEKDTFVRWAIGVVIAGSAVEIANLLFKGNT
ncbi:VirB2 family type IV secretion system major pilin TrwL [Bartonella sp. B39]